MIADIGTFLANFLRGDLDTPFVLKVITVLVISGGVLTISIHSAATGSLQLVTGRLQLPRWPWSAAAFSADSCTSGHPPFSGPRRKIPAGYLICLLWPRHCTARGSVVGRSTSCFPRRHRICRRWPCEWAPDPRGFDRDTKSHKLSFTQRSAPTASNVECSDGVAYGIWATEMKNPFELGHMTM